MQFGWDKHLSWLLETRENIFHDLDKIANDRRIIGMNW